MIDLKYTGKQIKKLRVNQGLTQQDLADILKLGSIKSISGWETGKQPPPLDDLVIMACLAGCDVNDFINPDDFKRISNTLKKEGFSNLETD